MPLYCAHSITQVGSVSSQKSSPVAESDTARVALRSLNYDNNLALLMSMTASEETLFFKSVPENSGPCFVSCSSLL